MSSPVRTGLALRPLVRDVLATEGLAPPLDAGPGLTHLVDLLRAGSVTVITGAGISTESGIPDYRGPTGRARNATPMHFDDFARSEAAQRRYWARAYTGWTRMGEALPNPAHHGLAALQRAGLVTGVITQNVDRLHVRAGSDPVIELHGTLDRVVCLACRTADERESVQHRLRQANPHFDPALIDIGDDAGEVRPDGDAAILESRITGFRTVPCRACGHGPLKPDVVFFGENVPRGTVEQCTAWVEASRSVLVLGSSLAVMSAYRFVRHAHRLAIPVTIVNDGPTRGDAQADVRIAGRLGDLLPRACQELGLSVF